MEDKKLSTEKGNYTERYKTPITKYKASSNTVLGVRQFTCDKCQLKKRYSTGADEYPAYTTIEYCSKGHWEGGDIPSADDIDNWSNCADFLP